MLNKNIILLGVDSYKERMARNIKYYYPHLTAKNFDPDPKDTFEQTVGKIEKLKPIAILNRGEEFIELHSQLIDYFQLPGPSYSAVKLFRDKAALHQLMVDNKLEKYRPETKTISLEKLKNEIRTAQFPLVIKPYQGAKGRGVYILKSATDFNNQIIQELESHFTNEPSLKDKTEQKVLIEEFIEGQQLTCTSYLDHKNKLHALGFMDVLDGYDVGQNHRQLVYRTTPSKYPEQVKKQVISILQQLANISQLQSTFIHPDFIVTPDNRVKLIEVNVRMGGLRYEIVKHASGINLNVYALKLAMGEIPDDIILKKDSCTGVDIWSPKTGIVEKLTLPHSSRIIGSEFSLSLGDKYVAPPQGNQHLVRFYVSSKNNSLEIAQKILGETKISIISK